ncbi:hypothetical protein BROUX41_004787 [Berkeleyomyces rouxiae]
MKHAVVISLLASVAEAASHGHRHLHKRATHIKRNELVERDAKIVWVPGPTKVVYKYQGETLDAEDAAKGIKNGEYVVVGESEPTFKAPVVTETPTPTHTPTSTPTIEPSSTKAAVFIEAYSSSSITPVSLTSSTTSTSSTAPAKSSQASYNSNSGTGLDTEFPSGTIKCSEFPSDYGAIPQNSLGFGGWTGLQNAPNYFSGDSAIDLIHTGVEGDTCTEKTFCSYSCPPGHEKSQWPSAQGTADKALSIGGLYCNSDGYLELTRDGYNTLCVPGAGGVYIQNDLDELVSTCRTDYPGTESMVIPAIANAGQKIPLTNPYSPTSYVWQNKPTTAQYYVNKKGYGYDDACVWNSERDPKGAGNWAPVNIGVGKSADGITYISIFPNLPTSTALLDFNIEITGDVAIECKLENGVYSVSTTGCTTGVKNGGTAIIRFY